MPVQDPPQAAPRGRVLVTGADGMIGRAVVAELLATGREVSALSLSWSAPLTGPDRIFTGDAADERLVAQAMIGTSAVVHLAAIPHPDLGTARDVFVGNTSATFTVLNTAGTHGVGRVVLASSINAFGIPLNRHDVSPAYYPLDEASPVAHDDAYSLSKWVDEQTAAWAGSRFGMTVVALRFPNVRPLEELRRHAHSLRTRPDERRRLAREGWSYLDLDDAVRAIVLALEAPITGAHTLIVAADDTLLDEPTETLLDRYAASSERRARFDGFSAPIDTTAARTLLGWTPQHSIRTPETVRDSLEEASA